MQKIEGGFRVIAPAAVRERRRNLWAVLVFGVAYALVCGLVAAPKGYFTPGHDIPAATQDNR